MLGEELPLTFTIVLTLLVANVIGGIAAFLLAAHLARVVLVRATVLVPVILSVVLIGAVQASRQWEDMGFPIAIGLVGWVMKRVRWSCSPSSSPRSWSSITSSRCGCMAGAGCSNPRSR